MLEYIRAPPSHGNEVAGNGKSELLLYFMELELLPDTIIHSVETDLLKESVFEITAVTIECGHEP